MAIKDLLSEVLTKTEMENVPTSFDILGSREKSIAIIDIPEELKKKKKLIAEKIIKQHKNVVTVLNKKTPRKGEYRLREYEKIIGSETEVIHKESGCRFLIDPTKTYFSQREATERLRISEMVKKNETVMVFFAGAGPFNIVIQKKANPERNIGIEMNPDSVEYFKKNIELNKTENIETVLGDVKEKYIDYENQCDRVIMPLPESSIDFLKEAIACLKKNGVCHLYCFCNDDELIQIKNKIKEQWDIKFIGYQKVLPWGPSIYKTRIDFRLK